MAPRRSIKSRWGLSEEEEADPIAIEAVRRTGGRLIYGTFWKPQPARKSL